MDDELLLTVGITLAAVYLLKKPLEDITAPIASVSNALQHAGDPLFSASQFDPLTGRTTSFSTTNVLFNTTARLNPFSAPLVNIYQWAHNKGWLV